mgnify:CR=1 FL=1
MKTLICCVFTLLLALPAAAETLTVAADPWPPFVNEDHEEGGVALAIIREALSRKGYQVELNIMPWARAEDGVRSGDYDILPGTWYTESRAEELRYSEPYATNEVKFIKRADDDFEYNGMDSLSGKTVGVIRDYGYGDKFSSADNFSREAAPDLMTNIRKLVNGRVDLAIEDELVARFLINEADPSLLDQIEFVDPPYSSNDLHLTSGHANPRSEAIVEAFNEGLKAMKKDGTFDAIMSENNLK